jgi:cytochrome c oxidase assembly protein subunit 15
MASAPASPAPPQSAAPQSTGRPAALIAVRPVRALRRRPTPATVTRLALLAVIANIGIVVTGGAVRLTNSGLGCPSWPDCTGSSLVPTEKLSWHKYVEFGNRLLTVVITAAVVAVLVAVYRSAQSRPVLRRWAWVTFLGVPAQAVLGGITVLTKLNPWVVSAHFMLSMSLIAAATVLWWRSRDDGTPSRPRLPILVERLGWGTWLVTFAVLYVGTVVTGSGPHAGDAKAHRTGLKPASISQLHADLVMLLVGLAIAVAVAVAALGAPRVTQLASRWLLAALAFQAAVGFTQYFSKLPVGLVELHVTGAACIAAVATAMLLSLRSTADDGAPSRGATDSTPALP